MVPFQAAIFVIFGGLNGNIHSGKLTLQCKMDPLKMYFLLKMGIFHCYVSLPEGKTHFNVFFLSPGFNPAAGCFFC